jgi:hypothetical protein
MRMIPDSASLYSEPDPARLLGKRVVLICAVLPVTDAIKRQACRVSLLAVALLLSPMLVSAQPREGRSLYVALGQGLSAPYDDSDVDGSGVFVMAEYVITASRWAGVRPYAGVLWTTPDGTDVRCSDADLDCEVTAQIALIGAKGRLAVPIPWVAPFIELGVGASVGTLRTRTPEEDKESKGLALHIPFAIGLALGADHKLELAFEYYFHPAVKQFDGAVAVGLSFPLD